MSLRVIDNRIVENMNSPFQLYEQEWNFTNKRGHIVRGPFECALINVDTIVGTAFIVPTYFDTSSIPDTHIPKYADRLWNADHQFFDRSGWDDVHVLINNHPAADLNVNNDDIPDIFLPINAVEVNNDVDVYFSDENYDSDNNYVTEAV